jgi:hypothetical protein
VRERKRRREREYNSVPCIPTLKFLSSKPRLSSTRKRQRRRTEGQTDEKVGGTVETSWPEILFCPAPFFLL